MSPWWKRPTEETIEHETATTGDAVQSIEVIEASSEPLPEEEPAHSQPDDEAGNDAPEPTATDSPRSFARSGDSFARIEFTPVTAEESLGTLDAVSDEGDEATSGDDPASDDNTPAALEAKPKPRRRRSSRRRGSGSGGANAVAPTNSGSAEPTPELEPAVRAEEHAVTHGDAVLGRAPHTPAPQARRDGERRDSERTDSQRDGRRGDAPRGDFGRGDGGRSDSGRSDAPRDAGRSDFGRPDAPRGDGPRDSGYRDSAQSRLRPVGRADNGPDAYARTPPPRPAPITARETAIPDSAALVTAREVAHQIADALREALGGSPETETSDASREKKIGLFCDLENIAIGVRDSEIKKFDIDLVLERLLEKGKIIVKKAYADWQRYTEFKKPLHTAGIELIDIPQKYYSGKNSADIKMVVDAMDLCYSKEHLDTFVLLSGDSDFTPLVLKLKENNKHVIGVGVKSSSSKLLIDNCDEFIYYEDIWRDSLQAPVMEGVDEKKAEAFALMNDSISALIRENKSVLWGSMVKQTMQRKRPSFNEGYYGYGSFSDLLEDAERRKLIHLKKDARSGSYVVTGFVRAR